MHTESTEMALDYIANLVNRAIEHSESGNLDSMDLCLKEAEFAAEQFEQDKPLTFLS